MKRNDHYEEEAKLTALESSGLSIQVEKEGVIIFQSSQPMLKPLLLCISQHSSEMAGATVIDKIVGLAAALLCIYGRVERVITPLASLQAQKILQANNIEIFARRFVPQIMNRDNTGPCPMEQLAATFNSPDSFFAEMKRRTEK